MGTGASAGTPPGATPDAKGAGGAGRRRLGDAWQGWDPGRDAAPAQYEDGPLLYLAGLAASALAATLLLGALAWLAAPRLMGLGLDGAAMRRGAVVLMAVPWVPFPLLAAVLACRGPRPLARHLQRAVLASWPLVATLAAGVRLSRDRLGHAFLELTNRLALTAHPGGRGPLLVLAPRCLRRDLLDALRGIAAERGIRCAVAGGGEQAREAIRTERPAAVLAIACERDLVSGVRDVAPHMTVLTLANRRPEGPCRNSEIDLGEVRRLLGALEGLGAGRGAGDRGGLSAAGTPALPSGTMPAGRTPHSAEDAPDKPGDHAG